MKEVCPCGRIIQKEGLTITGKVTVLSYPAGAIEKFMISVMTPGEIESMGIYKAELGEEFALTLDYIKDPARQRLVSDFIRSGKIETVQKIIIVDSSNYGIDILIQYLISSYNGSNPFPLGIAWGEIGTGATTPSVGDTALTTPTNRATVSYASDQAFETAQLQFFFPDAILANETYYEFGSFIGGSGSIGSGNMFNHALFTNPYSKSSGTDSVIEIDISLSNS